MVNLKSNIRILIDRMQDEDLLRALYYYLKLNEKGKLEEHWIPLTREQQREILLSFGESEDNNDLID